MAKAVVKKRPLAPKRWKNSSETYLVINLIKHCSLNFSKVQATASEAASAKKATRALKRHYRFPRWNSTRQTKRTGTQNFANTSTAKTKPCNTSNKVYLSSRHTKSCTSLKARLKSNFTKLNLDLISKRKRIEGYKTGYGSPSSDKKQGKTRKRQKQLQRYSWGERTKNNPQALRWTLIREAATQTTVTINMRCSPIYRTCTIIWMSQVLMCKTRPVAKKSNIRTNIFNNSSCNTILIKISLEYKKLTWS